MEGPDVVRLPELWVLRLQHAQGQLEQVVTACLAELGVAGEGSARWVVDLQQGVLGRVMPAQAPGDNFR